jgi:hypothetical protein
LNDPESRVREAAARALCDTRDGELLPDLLKAASGASDEKARLLAVRGCIRLTTQEEGGKLSNGQKLAALRTILALPLAVSEKRLVLSSLGAILDIQALDLSAGMLNDPSVKAEAALAVIHIVDTIAATRPEESAAALTIVLAGNPDPAIRSSAEEARKKVWKMSGYVTRWEVAGPYERQGKDFSELFDIPFAPETGDAASVQWRSLPVNANPAESWKMDLLEAIGGQQRAAYARTWIRSAKEQHVRLEIGSDDGVKVWLNGVIVHANNVARALLPGSDQVEVTLNQGWNPLMLKVTQNVMGWEFCVRFAQANDEPVELQTSLSPDTVRR